VEHKSLRSSGTQCGPPRFWQTEKNSFGAKLFLPAETSRLHVLPRDKREPVYTAKKKVSLVNHQKMRMRLCRGICEHGQVSGGGKGELKGDML
jgi:hypothetical protein